MTDTVAELVSLAEKIKETSTQQTLHAVVSDDAAANGDFSTNSIRNSAENVKEKLSDRDTAGRRLSAEQQRQPHRAVPRHRERRLHRV